MAATTATNQFYIDLSKTLHPRLQRFFRRYPPPAFLEAASQISSSHPPTPQSLPSDIQTQSNAPLDALSTDPTLKYQNPFKRHKSPLTVVFADPVYSLRRQAELVKLAEDEGVRHFLPPTVKDITYRAEKRKREGLRVKGTGVGQKVKGKKEERALRGKLEARREAMMGMPRLIEQWKELGHGRGWKKWPK